MKAKLIGRFNSRSHMSKREAMRARKKQLSMQDEVNQFVRERNESLLSLDKKKIDAYLRKYHLDIPENETVYWGGVHKAICNLNIPAEQKQESIKWLKEHGMTEYVW